MGTADHGRCVQDGYALPTASGLTRAGLGRDLIAVQPHSQAALDPVSVTRAAQRNVETSSLMPTGRNDALSKSSCSTQSVANPQQVGIAQPYYFLAEFVKRLAMKAGIHIHLAEEALVGDLIRIPSFVFHYMCMTRGPTSQQEILWYTHAHVCFHPTYNNII